MDFDNGARIYTFGGRLDPHNSPPSHSLAAHGPESPEIELGFHKPQILSISLATVLTLPFLSLFSIIVRWHSSLHSSVGPFATQWPHPASFALMLPDAHR